MDTNTKLTATPTAEVINITGASSSKSLLIIRSTARKKRTPVTTHINKTDVNAPMT